MNSRQRALTWPYPRRGHFQKELREAAAQWFQQRGLAVDSRYPYILDDRKNWQGNMVSKDVADLVQGLMDSREPTDPFPLHKYIHHGLSSQAMLFNLVGMMKDSGDYKPLQVALEQQGIPFPKGKVDAEFEVEDRKVFAEDSGQPTSIDLVVRGDHKNETLYVECKLSEAEFGGCSVFEEADCDGRNPAGRLDSCYLHHIGRRYWTLLDENGFLDTAIGTDSMCVLANHYQFFREVLFAIFNEGRFVLLYDERNPAFFCKHKTDPCQTRGLMEYLLTLVPQNQQSNIGHVTVQQVVSAIHQVGGHEDWIGEFERKYGLKPI